MIISVLNQKGGAGKSTLSVNLARSFTKRGLRTLLVDSDRQGSAQHWHEQSGGELIDMTCLCMSTLDKDVVKYLDRYERIIIDGVCGISPLTVSAIKASNLVLVPVQPSLWDIKATKDIVPIIQDRICMTDEKLKAYFVVSRKIVGTKVGKKIVSQLLGMGLPTLQNVICDRVDYVTCLEDGLSVLDGVYYKSKACQEIEQITTEVEGILNGIH